MYLEVPMLPEPSTALIFDKNSDTDTHDNDTYSYDIKLMLHTIILCCNGVSYQIYV